MGASAMRILGVGIVIFLSAVFQACSTGSQPPTTEQQPETVAAVAAATSVPPEPTATPTPTQTPTPVPETPQAPEPTPDSTAVPSPQDAMAGLTELTWPGGFMVDESTRWQELFDTLTTAEQSCIRTSVGEDLESVLEQPVMPGETYRAWEAPVFGCLEQDTATGIFLASMADDLRGLPVENVDCLGRFVMGTDLAGVVAASAPDAGSDGAAVLDQFTQGLMGCIVGLIPTGEGGMAGVAVPLPGDESLLWRHLTGGPVFSAPTVVDGVIYAGSEDGRIYALDAETGEVLWSFETSGAVVLSPTVDGGTVYARSNDNHVYALTADDGELMWRHETGGWGGFSPVASGGLVYLGAMAEGDFRIHALDAASGETVWVAGMPTPVDTGFAPAVVGGKVYVPGQNGEFHALDALSGEMVWSFDKGITADSPPAVLEGVVYLTAVNRAYALSEETGDLLWDYDTDQFPARDFPAVIADGVYYFSPDNNLYALDPATGAVRWSYDVGDMINTKPLAVGGVVYVGTESNRFYALDSGTGAVLWSREAGDYGLESPTVAESVLYVESSDGRLRALNAVIGEEIWGFDKGYFSDAQTYTVSDGVVYVGSFDGGVYAFTAPSIR